MKDIKKIFVDLLIMLRVLGLKNFFKYILFSILSIPEILNKKSFQCVDLKMGSGPFKINFKKNISFNVMGFGIFSGIREIFLRDVYLKRGLLQIKDHDIVVDLGANIGNFSNLALAHGPNIKVIAIEPSKALNQNFIDSLNLNTSFLNRVTLINSFFGLKVDCLFSKIENDPNYSDAKFISEYDLLAKIGVNRIDFLKCDIEGGEFYFLQKESILLSITKSIAIEIHSFAGDVNKLIDLIRSHNFNIINIDFYRDGSCILIGKKD